MAASNSKRGNVTLLMGASLALLQMGRTVTASSVMDLRYMTAPYQVRKHLRTHVPRNPGVCASVLLSIVERACQTRDVIETSMITTLRLCPGLVTRPTRVPVANVRMLAERRKDLQVSPKGSLVNR